MLKGKKILLGVCGGIAAYKSVLLLRLLKQEGAEVKVILTENAADFVGEITFSTLSKKPVYSEIIADKKTGEWTNHVALANWADLFVIAPLTAKTMAKMVTGMTDNLLMLTYLSSECKTLVAPAMDLEMYQHFSTSENLEKLKQNGTLIADAEVGFLASGLEGKGRMAEPENILQKVKEAFLVSNPFLQGKKVLINAGPTYEDIDPVRYIGNKSSGKMGYALAEAAIAFGADVTLVSGPSQLKEPKGLKHFEKVRSAIEMHQKCLDHFPNSDLAIFSAAVADFRPQEMANHKIKKSGDNQMTINLVKNPDILQDCGSKKKENQILVGFALETQNAEAYAKDKLRRKNCNYILMNSLEDVGAGFEVNSNLLTLFGENERYQFDLKSKNLLSFDIINYLRKDFE